MSTSKVRLLLVDDDPSVIHGMSRMLAQYPDQRFATSGELALRLAREEPPDLILMDVDMPGMSGFDVSDALQADPALASIPVIFVTSNDTPALHVTALQKGAADYVNKPLVAAQLTARVRAQVRSIRQIDELRRDVAALHAAPEKASERTPCLLIVDDDIASIHILRHTLAAAGDLHFAQSGEEALRLARRLAPDLILLDAHMPNLDGFDVCRTLKAEAAFRSVPIAFITRYSDPRHETRALDLGAADFIAKPYTAAVLQARVRNLLELKRRTDADLQAVRERWRRVGDARVADIVGAASDAIVTYNTNRDVVLINEAACRMFGVEHRSAIGRAAAALLGADLASQFGKPGMPAPTLMTRSCGDTFPVEASTSRIGDGDDQLTTVMLRDVSDRERLKAESRSRIEAETASRTKTQMMSYIAHEMGNPLNGLLGFARLIAEDEVHPLRPEQAARMAHVMTCGRQLQVLMRDVLDVGSFETGKLAIDCQALDVVPCVQAALEAVSTIAGRAGVAMSHSAAEASIQALGDADRLLQCLLNLLTNAIKYNRPGGWVRVELGVASGEVVIAVRDNGIGMDAVQRRHLFEPFNRLGRECGATPGAGLGMLITRQLVEAMKGRLSVDSEPDAGSCFSIVLPAAPPASPEQLRQAGS